MVRVPLIPKILSAFILVAQIGVWCSPCAYGAAPDADMPEIEIKVSRPTFVLPQFAGPFSEREASIAPEEYETAERLRSLLDSGDRKTVLAELEKFYNIEMSVAMVTLKAQIYFSMEMYDKAEKTYLAALARKPQLVRAHADLGQLYMITDNPQKARKHFAAAVSYGANNASVHGQLAYLNLVNHGPFSAISEYQQAMALEPENIQWQQGLLAALSQANMNDSASSLISEMLDRNPDDETLWLNKAAISLKAEDYKEALASLEMAMLLGNRDARNIHAAAQLHLQLNSYDRASELIKTQLKGDQVALKQLSEYVAWLAQAGRWKEADELLGNFEGNLKAMAPREKSVYYLYKAQVLNGRKRTTEAEQNFSLAVSMDPTHGRALIEYAGFSASINNTARAEMLYSRAQSINAVEKDAILGKAQLYLDMFDYESALEQLRKAYTRYPELVDLKDNITVVESIIRARTQGT